jgi:hypothetical protein
MVVERRIIHGVLNVKADAFANEIQKHMTDNF